MDTSVSPLFSYKKEKTLKIFSVPFILNENENNE